MHIVTRDEIGVARLPGRAIQTAVGKDGHSASGGMTVGFGRYSAESGPMEPHRHAEEVIYVIDAAHAWTRFGPERDALGERVPLRPGMILHNPPQEWHVYGYDEGGFADLLFIYGQVDDIRPEEAAR